MRAASILAGRRAVVFDLDGTLADTAGDLWLALNDALAEHGLPAVPRELVTRSLHGGLGATARAALESIAAPAAVAEDLVKSYERHYRDRMHASSVLYPGVDELLRSSAESGVVLGVCTNKSRAEAVGLLDKLQVAHWFDCIMGIDSVPHPKPHPQALASVLSRLRTAPHEALFVGDSPVDARCAAGAGVDFLLHVEGYGADQIDGLPVAARFERYADLLG